MKNISVDDYLKIIKSIIKEQEDEEPEDVVNAPQKTKRYVFVGSGSLDASKMTREEFYKDWIDQGFLMVNRFFIKIYGFYNCREANIAIFEKSDGSAKRINVIEDIRFKDMEFSKRFKNGRHEKVRATFLISDVFDIIKWLQELDDLEIFF